MHTYLHMYIQNTRSTNQLKQQAVTNWTKLCYIESFKDSIRQKDMSIQVTILYCVTALEMRKNLQLQSSPDSANTLWATAFLAYTNFKFADHKINHYKCRLSGYMCFYNKVWEFFTSDTAVFFVSAQFYTSSVFNNYNIYLQVIAYMISHSTVHFLFKYLWA
jgi:hypothetical protein